MKTMVKLGAALLIVFSVAIARASVDSVSLAPYCRVIEIENGSQVRVLYQSPETANVNIQIFDLKDRKIHEENIYRTDGFVKEFDFGFLPEGEYRVKVNAGQETYEEMIFHTLWNGENLQVSMTEGKVALVGKNDSGQELSIFLKDQKGNVIHSEEIQRDEELKKLFRLEEVEGDVISLVIYAEGRFVKEETIEL